MNRNIKTKQLIGLLLLVSMMVSSCATKKDCRGRTKHKLSNGIWM